MDVQNRPLGTVMQMVEEMGSEVTYAYDDLVFINHNAFIVQFTDDPTCLNIYFNNAYKPDKIKILSEALLKQGPLHAFEVTMKGTYELEQKDGENLDIKFFDY